MSWCQILKAEIQSSSAVSSKTIQFATMVAKDKFAARLLLSTEKQQEKQKKTHREQAYH